MPWLLLLHISGLVVWCGSLLYLPALISGAAPTRSNPIESAISERDCSSLARMLFTLVATPAALFAILSGTVIFLTQGILEFWLMAKLTVVVALVTCHLVGGLLIMRAERGRYRHLTKACVTLGVIVITLIMIIFWLVLAKPLQEAEAWTLI